MSAESMSSAPTRALDIVMLGLSITSSWGNGHATTYRALVRELTARGHRVTFLERDVPWYAANRDLPRPPFGETLLYPDLPELFDRHASVVRDADVVLIGSYVPDGSAVADWALDNARGLVTFYDIDTPVTLAALTRGDATYVTRQQIARFDLYLSFTGGPLLDRLEREFGARRARALYCSVDPREYYPDPNPAVRAPRWDLGYLGTYAEDRQPALHELLLAPAERRPGMRFVVAGPGYPDEVVWPANVERIDHLPPPEHRAFYNSQRFTLNLTRADMVACGYAPSVRLFEAAACGAPIISDWWPGLDEMLLPDEEILIARSGSNVLDWLGSVSDADRRELGARGRARILAEHTSAHRALEFERYLEECAPARRRGATRSRAATGAPFRPAFRR